MNKIRWGILSTAKIAVKDVIPAMRQGDYCEITAISSRSLEKAESIAKTMNIETAVGSYEELLSLPNIDAIYNPLPNHMHVSWSIKALQAGKHVLCEKPIGLFYEEAQKLASEADNYPGLKVMEAFMYRHHPRWQKIKELVANGSIGELRTVRSFFSYFNDDPENIRNKPEMGGGSLMDVGCYCISVPRFLFGDEPAGVFGSMVKDPEFGIDRLTSGIMEFSDGTATFTCSTQLARHQTVSIFGTEGKIEIPAPFNPPTDRHTSINLYREGEKNEIQIDPCNQYTIQGDLFSQAILQDKEVPTKLNDALVNMKILDAVVQSSDTRKWVAL